MDIMRDWLGPTIEHQLERVLRWKEQGSAGFPTSEQVAYEDDGSNLRVRLKKVGSLQIVKFEAYEDPIKAILSDSYTFIQATFASSIVRAYVTKYQKRITAETKGSIIDITQYEIVATHLGPTQSSVTLLVQDLHVRGCHGSATFGQPVPIQERHRVGLLVRRIRELKSVEVSDTSKDSEKDELVSPSSKRPPIETLLVGEGSHGDDRHATLATQVVFRSQMLQNQNLESTVANHVQPNKNSSRTSEETRLLGLLTKAKKHGIFESPTNRTTRDLTRDRLVTDKPLSKSSEKHGGAAQHSDSGPHLSPHRSAPQATSTEKMRVNDHGEAIERLHQEQSGVNGDGILVVTPKVLRVIKIDTERSRNQESKFRTNQHSYDNTKERNPQMIPDRKSQAVEKHEVHTQSSKDFSIALPSQNNIGEHLTSDPWNGITRIRGRDARIPKDQQKLLGHVDSWFPPQPGRRGPVANVPIAILQALNAAAERCAGESEPAEEQQAVLELDITGSQQAGAYTESEAEQDSDEERYSGWSSSSLPSGPDDQLPPDSSLEASVPPDRISRKNLLHDPTAAEDGEKDISSSTAPRAQVQSGCAGPENPIQVAQLESCDASRSDNGLPSQTPTAQAQPLLDQDNVRGTHSFESVAQPENVISENPTSNDINDTNETSELDDAVVDQANETDEDGTGVGRYPQEIFAAAGSAGAVANVSQVPNVQSPVRSSHSPDQSSEDDNLESKLPQALGDENAGSDQDQVYGLISPPLLSPSTVFHEGKPTLQVKRTPYHPRGARGASPCNNTSPALLPLKQDRCTLGSIGDGLAADYSTLAEVVIPGTHDRHSDTNMAGNSPSLLGADGTEDDILMYDGEAVENQQRRLETDTRSHEGSNKSPFKSSSSGLRGLGVGSKYPLDPTPYLPVVNERKNEKRKATDMDQLSPYVTKRRKRIKPPPALNFSQENRQTQDPSLIARQHRREFLASRKSHHPTNAADELVDVTSQKIDQDAVAAEDAAQRTTSLPEESASMELDQLPPDTVMHVTAFESIGAGGNSALPEYEPRSGDHTPRNKNVELGDDLAFSLDRSNKASGLTGVLKSSSPTASTRSPALPTKGSAYDTFKSTYPKYSGGFEHFSSMCQRINGLLQAERMEHRSLWDDFVIRHRTDYRDYLLDCTDRGDDPMAYEKFYKHHIDEPIHRKHVLTPATLNDAIASIERTGAGLQPERSFRSPAKVSDNGGTIVKASPHEPRSQMKAREVIDFTLEGPAPSHTLATDHPSKQRRALSWTEPAKAEIDSPAFGNKVLTPKSALTREGSTPVQTPSREFRGPKQTPKQQTPVQIRNNPVQLESTGPPMVTADKPPDGHKSLSPHETSESNRSTVVEWLGRSSSDTASPSIPESPRLGREETEEEQWWRDRNTPFKAFARAYASLKSVEGRLGTVDQEGVLRASPRQLDVLSWKL